MGETFAETILSGSLLIAIPVAALAGLVSFLSPCVLPLVPGYLSYVTGLSGIELTEGRRSRVVVGALLFVLGFSVVFVSYGALFGGLGSVLREYADPITRAMGVVLIVLGLVFGGWLPGAAREWRWHVSPAAGVASAPLVGALFGIGWTACTGPTLAAVQALAFDDGSAARGALLSLSYCLGLGLPFVIAALAYRRALGAFGWVRKHQVWVLRIGGAMLIALGLLLVTGIWTQIVSSLQGWIGSYEVAL
ncbi:MAG TPA: cytochrome c biogenesis protein CcdA [Jiangellaceae bacterium]|jgi:cytochrome c-type biogenesis protein|nr:cytochrome c biogenesis protein CcdA [Jiangellaceae bacterium]